MTSILRPSKIFLLAASRALGSVGNFLIIVIISRLFGLEATGYFVSAVSFAYIVSVISNFGLSRHILKSLSFSDECEPRNLLKQLGFVMSLFGLMAAGSILLLLVHSSNQQLSVLSLAVGTFLGFCFSFSLIVADLLKSMGKPEISLIIENTAFPWICLVGLPILNSTAINSSITPLISALISSSLIFLMISVLPLGGRLKVRSLKVTKTIKSLLNNRKQMLLFWMTGITVALVSRGPGALGPTVLNSQEAGMFAVSLGIVSLGGTILQATQAYYAPIFASNFNNQKSDFLARALFSSSITACILFSPIFLSVILAPEALLKLFSANISDSFRILLVTMTIGQGIRLLFGNSEIMLSMINKPELEIFATSSSMILFFLIAFFPVIENSLLNISIAYSSMIVCRGAVAAYFALRNVSNAK